MCTFVSFGLLPSPGSVYRDEFDLAILKMQEDNRLEILKRKWWDGGKCPKEEDHRAKGWSEEINPLLLVPQPLFPFSALTNPFSPPPPSLSAFILRSGNGEHRWHLRGAGLWPAGGDLHGRAGVCLDVEAGARKRGERGLSNLHLLCLPLPSPVPPPSWSCQASQLPAALTARLSGFSFFSFSSSSFSSFFFFFVPLHSAFENNQHKNKAIPHFYHTQYMYIFILDL